MAANYWDSTQAKHWTFTNDELANMREKNRESNRTLHNKYEMPERRHVNIFLQQQIVKLGRRLNLRQQVLATAQIYVRRFYYKVEIRRTNPYLVMTTAIYLACKMEECPVHIRFMLGEAARHWPELGISDSSKIGECEFHLISTLSSRLIIHHPYRTITDLAPDLNMTAEESGLAANIVNDHYNTDLPLLYPPHVVAVTAIFLAIVLRPPQSGLHAHSAAATTAGQVQQAVQQGMGAMAGGKNHHAKIMKMTDWLAESQVDIEAVIHSTQELISLYELWETYSERPTKEAISRFLKDGVH
ncbi:RNA polymerase II holoenzyme cyclin-like subunit [Sphaceloma murrayae]|uniref:RNA polymerase II holoenzyme cyclin-like subunit n=1 Tax=Sphaceloma murrayae TaxID=2082308 RepID=A0A2K1QV17_9PEZI|nr:RNA polymerase II holoenzyme cyclin-like subunit [Sphaceloma murrayae]